LLAVELVFEEQEVANMAATAAPVFDTVRHINSSATVPDNNSARLMYYLDCKHYFSELS